VPGSTNTVAAANASKRRFTKQLIGARMLVPWILPGEHPQAQTTGVYLAEDLVPVLLGDRSRFRGDIHHDERGVAYRLAGIGSSGDY
jgi:hypothetical protein